MKNDKCWAVATDYVPEQAWLIGQGDPEFVGKVLYDFDRTVRPQLSQPGWHVDHAPHHGPVHVVEGVPVVTLVLRAWRYADTESGECDQTCDWCVKQKKET